MKRQPGAYVIGVGLLIGGLWTVASVLYPLLSGRANVRLWGLPELWPALLTLAGSAMLAQAIFGTERQPGLIFLGIIASLLGVFLGSFTLKIGNLGWGEMARWWPMFPIIFGFAFLILHIADDMRNSALLVPVYVIGGFGLFALPVTLGLTRGSNFTQAFQLWPMLAIVLALLVFFRSHPTEKRNDSDSSPVDH